MNDFHMTKNKLLIAGLVGVAVLVIIIAVVISSQRKKILPTATQSPSAAVDCQTTSFDEAILKVGEHEVSVFIADTKEERTKGLSGCTNLPENSGMYFVFSEPQPAAFWMKNMLLPLDIIWIKDEHVIGIEKNVPPPQPNTPDDELIIYSSPGEVDRVLELPAGASERFGIEPGTSINNI